MAAKSKTISSSTPKFAAGGKTKMFGPQFAGTQAPSGTTSHTAGSNGKVAKGGNTSMFGKQSAGSQKPGTTSHSC